MQALYHAQDQFAAILEQGASRCVSFFAVDAGVFGAVKDLGEGGPQGAEGVVFEAGRGDEGAAGEGEGGECFLRGVLRDQEKNEMDDEHVAYLAGIWYIITPFSLELGDGLLIGPYCRWNLDQTLQPQHYCHSC